MRSLRGAVPLLKTIPGYIARRSANIVRIIQPSCWAGGTRRTTTSRARNKWRKEGPERAFEHCPEVAVKTKLSMRCSLTELAPLQLSSTRCSPVLAKSAPIVAKLARINQIRSRSSGRGVENARKIAGICCQGNPRPKYYQPEMRALEARIRTIRMATCGGFLARHAERL